MLTKPDPQQIAPPLLAWFDRAKRDMPWRGTRDPYRVWLSEVMLQQTQVATATPYYERFLAAFPTVHDLAGAPLDEVLRLWAGLGYYSRARSLREAAQIVVREHGGLFPEAAEALRSLPGVGPYTSGAIASIAFGERVPAVDGNALRVLARVFLVKGDVQRGRPRARVERLAAAAVPEDRPGDYNQGLMELGSLICRPKDPLCGECPLSDLCRANAEGQQAAIPAAGRRSPVRHVKTVAGIVQRNGRLLIAQRPPDGVWGGMWELPNCEVDGGDAPTVLVQLLQRDFGLSVEVGESVCCLTHAIMNQRIELRVLPCRVTAGRTQARCHVAAKWVKPGETEGYALPAPHRKVLRRL